MNNRDNRDENRLTCLTAYCNGQKVEDTGKSIIEVANSQKEAIKIAMANLSKIAMCEHSCRINEKNLYLNDSKFSEGYQQHRFILSSTN